MTTHVNKVTRHHNQAHRPGPERRKAAPHRQRNKHRGQSNLIYVVGPPTSEFKKRSGSSGYKAKSGSACAFVATTFAIQLRSMRDRYHLPTRIGSGTSLTNDVAAFDAAHHKGARSFNVECGQSAARLTISQSLRRCCRRKGHQPFGRIRLSEVYIDHAGYSNKGAHISEFSAGSLAHWIRRGVLDRWRRQEQRGCNLAGRSTV